MQAHQVRLRNGNFSLGNIPLYAPSGGERKFYSKRRKCFLYRKKKRFSELNAKCEYKIGF